MNKESGVKKLKSSPFICSLGHLSLRDVNPITWFVRLEVLNGPLFCAENRPNQLTTAMAIGLPYPKHVTHWALFFSNELKCFVNCFVQWFINIKSATLQPYLEAVRRTLEAALCLEQFSSQVVERHNKPEVSLLPVVSLKVAFSLVQMSGK